jgi:nucleoside-diphosphate-sugar epimerase
MILITGGHGFLGSFLADSLKSDKYDVLCLGRDKLNVLDKESVDKVFQDNDIEYVIHTAVRGGRRTKPDSSVDFYENICMFENLVANRENFKFMINIGSGASFDRSMEIDCVEEEEVVNKNPLDFYGFSKNVIAKRIHGINDNIINLRIFNCFGEKELSDRMIKANCIRHMQNQEMIVYTNKKMDFFYINDLYRVVLYYLKNFDKGVPIDLNLCYKEKIDLIGITELIMTLTGQSNDVKLIDEINGRSYTGDPTKLLSLDIEFDGLESGILQVYKHLQSFYKE